MGDNTDRDLELHNKGEQDCADGKYDPPHGIISSSSSMKNAEESIAYSKGWENANKQKR
jgi:hypothetical protein